MNPATDVGKRDLPAVLKHHFTEMYVAEPTSVEDLCVLVQGYIGATTQSGEVVRAVVAFYREAKAKAVDTLVDSAGQKPQVSA